LLDNGYPLDFIFSNMQNRIKKFTHSTNQYNSSSLHSSTDNKKYFMVPYVQHTSDSFKSISKKFNLPIAFTIPNNIKQIHKSRERQTWWAILLWCSLQN